MKASYVFLALLCGIYSSHAQNVITASSLGQTAVTKTQIASDSWIAQAFGVPSPGCTIDSVQLLMDPGVGNPANFSVSIWQGSPVANLPPQANLGTLTGPDPAAGGLFTYTTPGIALAGGSYFLVVTAGEPKAQGSYVWAEASSYFSVQGLTIDDLYESSADGTQWTPILRQNTFEFSITGTVVPEPTPLLLMGTGAILLCGWNREKAEG